MDHEDQDALLQRYLAEKDPTVAQACLEGLLSEYVEPVVRDIARYKSRLNSSHEAQDEEDIRSEVVLQLIWWFRDLRSSGLRTPIENFRGYVATTTYNAYYKYVRMKYPARLRLKNRLRYLFNHRPDFAIWEDESQEYFCGLAAWRRDLLGRNKDLENQQLGSSEFVNSLGPGESVARMAFPELVNKFLAWRGRPILVDELVGIVAELQGIRDLQPLQVKSEYGEEGDSASICELLPDSAVDIASTVEQRFFLERLWKEVCQLPQRQRAAGYLTERNSGEPPRLQRGGHRVSVSASSEADDRLDSWKEIASHLKRTVRTVQRWEKHEGLPIHRHLHQRANSVYARRSELDDWWNREAHSIRVAPIQVPSAGSSSEITDSQAFTPIHPEGECRETGPTAPRLLVECVLESRAGGTCSPGDRAGHLIPVLRVRIHIPDCLPAPEAGSATKGAKPPCRSLSLAASRWSPYPVDSRDEHGKYIL